MQDNVVHYRVVITDRNGRSTTPTQRAQAMSSMRQPRAPSQADEADTTGIHSAISIQSAHVGIGPLGLAGVGYGGILHENFPYNLPEHAINVFLALALASLICLVAFAGLFAVYRRELPGCGRNAAGWSQDSWSRIWESLAFQRWQAAIEELMTMKLSKAQRSQGLSWPIP